MNFNKNNAAVNAAEVEKALRLILQPRQVTELRAFSVTLCGDRYVHKTVSGYFDDPAKLAKAAADIVSAKGIYFIPNVLNPALLARAANRIRPVKDDPTTADHDIQCRLYLLIDADVIRPAGISATDAEHEAAIAKAKEIRGWLTSMEWPDPIIADSGNGGHLMYRIDLPADDDGMIERILKILQERFGDAVVQIDQTVHNPARIWKLYGTIAGKGDSVPDRPHRRARIIECPEVLEVVPTDMLRALAGEAQATATGTGKAATSKPVAKDKFDLAGWIAENDLDVRGPEPWRDGQLWTLAGCPWNSDHTNGSAFIAQLPSGAISAGCHHDGCKGKDWHDLRDAVEPGWREERDGRADERGDRNDDGDKQRKSQADKLVELATECGVMLFHSPGGDPEAYVTIRVGNHHETMRVRSKAFKEFLSRQLWLAVAKVPAAQCLQDALNVLNGQALYDGEEHPVAVRLAEHGGDIYLDLANQDWQAVRVTPAGWEVVIDPPVRFVRPRGVLPLPVPERGGCIEELREFVNVVSGADFLLLVCCIVAYLRPKGPFPVLAIYGEQGSAKSTTTRIVRELIDPNVSPLRSEPRDARDLMIAASNGWMVALENLSSIPVWLSDALCRLATGGGFSTRELYSDGEEKLFDAKRPVLLNGIVEVVTRSDLADRAVAITLPSITEEKRMAESDFWPRFYAARPRILGALLDAAVMALRNLPNIKFDRLPRMADFAQWATAAEPGLGVRPGAFMDAYGGNRETLNETALESCVIVPFLFLFTEQNIAWHGTASQLLEALNGLATEDAKRQKGWPTKGHVLSMALRRIAPNLRNVGIHIEFDRTGKCRKITITRKPPVNSVTSVTECHSAPNADVLPLSGKHAPSVTPEPQSVTSGSGASPDEPQNTAQPAGSDGCDANDAVGPEDSGTPDEDAEWVA